MQSTISIKLFQGKEFRQRINIAFEYFTKRDKFPNGLHGDNVIYTNVIYTEQRLTKSPTMVKTCPNLFNAHVQNTPSIRHFHAILTPSWQVPPALLIFKRHLSVTKADVLLTFSTYKVLYGKEAGGKIFLGNQPGWRIDGDDEIREDNDFKGADRESDFCLIYSVIERIFLINVFSQSLSTLSTCSSQKYPSFFQFCFNFVSNEFYTGPICICQKPQK